MAGKRFFIVMALIFVTVTTSPSWGQVWDQQIPDATGPVEIEADEVVYQRAQSLYQARGNVEITMGSLRLTADEVDYYSERGVAEARGHVELTDGRDVLRCQSMALDLNTREGVMEDVHLVTQENFHITGKRVEKLGPEKYRIHGATFTTCSGVSPDWVLKAKRVDLTVEGYAVARHSVFAVKDTPIAYLPIGVYPVKTKRQTGFLIPRFGYSDKLGPEVRLPFFWAIAQDKDATISLDWLGDRGIKPGVEFRYALPKDTRVKANFYYIDDQEIDKDRWAFLYRHDQPELPLGFYARGDINLVSDNDYVYDFEEDFPDRAMIDVRTDRELESTFFVGRPWSEFNLVGEMSYFDDLTVRSNDGTLQRLPEISLNAFDQPMGNIPLYGGGELTYTHFWRQEGVRGSRLDLFPQISFPLRPLGCLRFLSLAGLRETLYWPQEGTPREDDFETRTLPVLEASMLTTGSRVFEPSFLGLGKIRHRIRPEVRYTYIPRVDQQDLPNFDEKDRIPYTSQITYGLTNFVDKSFRTATGSDTRQLLQLELSQSYSVGDPFFPGEDYPERQFSNIRGKLWLFPSPYLAVKSDAEYSLIRDQIVRHNCLAHFSDARGDSLTAEYRFSEDELEQINLFAQIGLWEWADLFASYRYDLFNDLRVETRAGFTYRAQCWNVIFSVEDVNRSQDRSREREVKFNIAISLVGLGSFGGRD
jgi:LPS-assembly protein